MKRVVFEKDSPERLVLNSFVKLCQDNYRLDDPTGDTVLDFDKIVENVRKWESELAPRMNDESAAFARYLGLALLNKLNADEKRAKKK